MEEEEEMEEKRGRETKLERLPSTVHESHICIQWALPEESRERGSRSKIAADEVL